MLEKETLTDDQLKSSFRHTNIIIKNILSFEMCLFYVFSLKQIHMYWQCSKNWIMFLLLSHLLKTKMYHSATLLESMIPNLKKNLYFVTRDLLKICFQVFFSKYQANNLLQRMHFSCIFLINILHFCVRGSLTGTSFFECFKVKISMLYLLLDLFLFDFI